MPSIFVILSTLGLLFGLFLTYWLHSRVGISIRLTPSDPPAQAPLLSIIVPARNEARNIQRCAAALLDQTYPAIELIVVDDRSTDGTSQILGQLQSQYSALRIVSGKDLPPDWAGKPHALVQGVNASNGEWLCFVDADTFAGSKLIASAFTAAQKYNADM
ncbi:MAG: glycosyltransferase family 2 protein, partial [Anaerolineales bacterium]